MRLEQIMLMGQHSMNDIETPLGDNFSVEITYASNVPAGEKPWPYEITYAILIRPSAQAEKNLETDGDADESAPKFVVELHYAARFVPEDENERDDSKLEALTAWPYARADFVQIFRMHEMPSELIPAIPALYSDEGQSTGTQTDR